MNHKELPAGFEAAVKRAAVDHYEHREGDALLKTLMDRNRTGRFAVEWVNGFLLGWTANEPTMVLSGVSLTQRDLLAGVMRNIAPKKRQGSPRWALVRDTFGNGSGVSCALCREFGYDPDEYLSTDPNYATDEKVLAHLRSVDGSTAWAMCGPLGMEREDVSKSLYRLKRKGLAHTKAGLKSYWMAGQ